MCYQKVKTLNPLSILIELNSIYGHCCCKGTLIVLDKIINSFIMSFMVDLSESFMVDFHFSLDFNHSKVTVDNFYEYKKKVFLYYTFVV